MSEVIAAEDIRVAYNGAPIISGLSFSVGEGDVLAVLGPNGSGKTTLLLALLGMVPLAGGRVRLFGRDSLPPEEAERLIAYLPQRLSVDRTFPISLGEMLALGPRGMPAARYLDMLELRSLFGKKVGELSGGQMQRALLAYAIGKEPRLLVMDEPTSWVDVKGADCVLCIIEEFKSKGIAMLIVSHDVSEVRAVATHVLGLSTVPEGFFFEPAGSPELDRKMHALFGPPHHGEHGGRCPV
jgi:ABC-type Mn2+/Zn2+ transport system ATPase subunit